jgi:FkbM family methyltransferase
MRNRDGKISWSESVLEILEKLSSKSIVVDVGACVGDFTIPFAKKVKMVVAIEPEPRNAILLLQRISRNRLKNVHVVKKAAWKECARLNLYLNDYDRGGHSVIFDGDKSVIKVEAETLDSIIGRLGIKRIDFMKMNIEGAELEALKGAKKSLNLVNRILVQTHKVKAEKTTVKVQKLLEECGFKTMVKSINNSCDLVYGKRLKITTFPRFFPTTKF